MHDKQGKILCNKENGSYIGIIKISRNILDGEYKIELRENVNPVIHDPR